MNYVSENNREIRELVLNLLGSGFSNAKRINFSVSYSQSRKLSVITVEVSPSSTIHALLFFYTRAFSLYDAFIYKSRTFHRLSGVGGSLARMDEINRFMLEKLPRYNPIAARKIAEETGSKCDAELKDQQIQRMKDRLRIEKDSNQSLRNQLKALRARNNR